MKPRIAAATRMPRWRVVALAILSTAGCGGNVDMGSNRSPDNTPNPKPTTGPTPEVGRTNTIQAFEFDTGFPIALAVSNEDLYIQVASSRPGSNERWLYRCRKDDCQATLTRRAGGGDPLAIVGQRLAFLGVDNNRTSVVSCALPACTDERVVIANVDWSSAFLFDQDSAYWSIGGDRTIYRCGLPDCTGGPAPFATRVLGEPLAWVASEDSIYWSSDLLHRAAKGGQGRPQTFSPGVELTLVDEAQARLDDSGPRVMGDAGLGLYDGMLYAKPISSRACDLFPDCVETIARWAVEPGGARETVVEESGGIGQFYVFGAELVWSAFSSDFQARQVWSCRVEDCAGSKRPLVEGPDARSPDPRLRAVADDQSIYWISGSSSSPYVDRILQTRLLPPPQ